MLPFQLVLISLKVYLSLSTIPITKYDNAQFIPDQGSDLITMLQLQTRDQCICQCSMNAVCTTVTYSGIDQSCSLYSSQFRREKLQLVTYDLNYVVFTLSNRMISTLTSTSTTSTSTTTSITTSTKSTTTSTTSTTTTTARVCATTCMNTTVSTSSRVAFYSFDSNILDSTGNYSLSASFTPTYVPGWVGSAVSFTYSSQRFLSTVAHIPLNARSFTIDLWFYVFNLTAFKDLSFGGEWQASASHLCLFLHIRDQVLRMVFFDDDSSGTSNLTINQWYHAAFVYDSSGKKQFLYLNGKLDQTKSVSTDFAATTGNFTIGGAYVGGDSGPTVYYTGYIDHFGISHRVKSPCEIYLNAVLFFYFRFDSISSLTDSGPNFITANNYYGTLTTGRVNQGIKFASSAAAASSYINITGVTVLNTANSAFTISMWINPLYLNANGTLIHTSTQSDGAGNCLAFWGFTSMGVLTMNLIDSSNSVVPMPISSLPASQWTHVAQVVDRSGKASIYINGDLSRNYTLSGRQAVGSYVFLGASPPSAGSCRSGSISTGQFYGAMDEFYAFATALTSAEICRLANP